MSGIDTLLGRAAALRRDGLLAEALAVNRAAAAADPEAALAQQHLGAMLAQMGRLDEAEVVLRRALALKPGDAITRHTLGGVLKALGQWCEGFALYEARFDIAQLKTRRPDASFPFWRSFDPAGRRITVFPEQGLGDQIMLARFLAPLAARGAEVTLLAPEALTRLFEASLPTVRVVEASRAGELPDPDFGLMAGDLPGFVGATPDMLPAAPYLVAPAAPPLPAGFKVGVMLRGNRAFWQDRRRSLDAAAQTDLRARLPGQVIDLDPERSGAGDFADTAAIVAGLDGVVSVDTSVAHLAGALGVRCFTLIPGFATDWRWQLERETTPWYPAMRLYRGTIDGEWGDAIGRLCADVTALAERGA